MLFFTRLSKSVYYYHYLQNFHTHSNNGGLLIDHFDRLLQHCIITIDKSYCYYFERPVKQIHAQILLTSSSNSGFLSARLISVYSKLALLNDARKVFDTAPEECFLSSLFWNSMLRASVSGSRFVDAVELYRRMRGLNVQPDGFGFPLVIRACGMIGDVKLCRIVHCHVVQVGFAGNLHVGNELLGMYGEIGCVGVASQVFDRMLLRSHVSWNILMSNFAKNVDPDSSLKMLCRMEDEGWVPNSVTWTSLISCFARSGRVDKTWEFYVSMRRKGINPTAEAVAVVLSVCTGMPVEGEIVHGHVVSAGFEDYIFVRNALITMYGRNGAIEKAEYLFSELDSKSLVSWNALLSAYAQSGFCDEALSVLLRLENSDEKLMIRPNVVCWTAVINGFAASGRHKETLELFQRMQFAQVPANAVTIAIVLTACAEFSALSLGREIHAHAIRVLMVSDMMVTNGLTNMYMKCGSLRTGHSIFEGMVCRDVGSWNIMITGYGMHGFGNRALEIFSEMVADSRAKPDEVTFVAVLSACSHSGLVAEGRELFHRMSTEFQIEPQVEHYACMVDLLGRAGLLVEASEVLKSMPMEPNAPVWGALLNSCKMHKNTDVAEETAAEIFNLNSNSTGSYMLLSNLYAENERWDESAKVRLSARTKGLRKTRGQSWIEVKNKLYSFSAGKALNLEMEELHGVLKDLNLQMVMESSVSVGIFGPFEAE